jgi:DNA-binding transcriptional regulator GbsR (MarR family)
MPYTITYQIHDRTLECGKYFEARSEREIDTKFRIHQKVCEKCRNIVKDGINDLEGTRTKQEKRKIKRQLKAGGGGQFISKDDTQYTMIVEKK